MAKQFARGAEFSRAIKEDLAKWNLAIIKVLLQWTGIWPEEQRTVVSIIGYIFIMNSLVIPIFSIWYLIENINDLLLTFVSAPIAVGAVQLFARLFTLVVYKKRFQKIISNIWFEFLTIKAATKAVQKQIYFTALFNRRYIYALIIFLFVATSQFLGWALLTGNLKFPLFFPFSVESPVYELLYMWQWSVYAVMACAICGLDCLYVTLIMICIIQFQIINSNLELVGTSNVKEKINFISMCNGTQELPSRKCLDRLILEKYIKQNILLIETCGNVALVFEYMLLFQLLTIGGTICLYNFMMIKYPKETMKLLAVPLFLTIELACNCWFGHELTSQAEKGSLSAYNAKWYEIGDLELQKAFISIIQTSNREMAITAGGFAKMNRNLLIQVFKFAMSVYTLLGKIAD